MLNAVYIGNDIYAAGFRLVGIDTLSVPEDHDSLWPLLNRERASRQLIILSDRAAAPIRKRISELLEIEAQPPILVLPAEPSSPDPSIIEARRLLGLEASTP